MNKSLITTVIVAFLLIGITTSWLLAPQDELQPERNSLIPDSFMPLDESRYLKIGHEDDALKGAAFTSPVENTSLNAEHWASLPVRYASVTKDADLVVTLDQQLYEQLATVVQQYARKNNLNISVNKGTCGVSASSLNKKAVDIAGFCCAPGTGDRLPGLKYHTLGIASIALLVNPANQVGNVSTDQARQIFSGNIKKWKKISAAPELEKHSIDVVTRLHCKTRPGHWTLILSGQDHFSPTARETGDIPYMIAEVNRNFYSVGYETLFMVQRENKPVKILEINNIHPANLEALAKGYYPFYRVYNLTTWQQPENNLIAEQLVDYLREYVNQNYRQLNMASLSQLEKNGWKIKQGELIGEPLGSALAKLED